MGGDLSGWHRPRDMEKSGGLAGTDVMAIEAMIGASIRRKDGAGETDVNTLSSACRPINAYFATMTRRVFFKALGTV